MGTLGEWGDPYDLPTYSYTRDGSWNSPFFIGRHFNPMVPMVMIPVFGRDTWWTISEAITFFPDEDINKKGRPFL